MQNCCCRCCHCHKHCVQDSMQSSQLMPGTIAAGVLLLASLVAACPLHYRTQHGQRCCQHCRSIMFCCSLLLQCLISCNKPEQSRVGDPPRCKVYSGAFPRIIGFRLRAPQCAESFGPRHNYSCRPLRLKGFTLKEAWNWNHTPSCKGSLPLSIAITAVKQQDASQPCAADCY